MARDSSHIDYELIVKYLTDETSPLERSQVENWIGESPQNQREFERIKALWEKVGDYRQSQPADVDPEAAWKRLKKRMGPTKNPAVIPFEPAAPRGHGFFFYLTRAAAAAVLVVVAVYLFRSGKDQPQSVLLRAETEIVKDTLSDGTSVALNTGTELTFAVESGERLATLSGEAFFAVERDSLRPFIIRTGEAIVKVVGTSFNLKADPGSSRVELTMESGKALLINASRNDSLLVSAGEKGIFDKETDELTLVEDQAGNDAFWLTKTLIFKRTGLSEVFAMLEETYEVKIRVINPDILNCSLSARYKDADLENILDQIAAVFGLTIEKTNGNYRITGQGCD